MNIYDAKYELCEYMQNLKYIEEKHEDIALLRCNIERATVSWSEKVSGGRDPKTFENQMAKLIDLENEHAAFLQEAETKRIAVEQKIAELPQPYCNVLFLRYIRGMTLERVAEQMNYSCRQIARLHAAAVTKYSDTKFN